MNGKAITAPIVHHIASGRYSLILPRNFGHAGMLRVLACLASEVKFAIPKL